jgi:hypothetical protein
MESLAENLFINRMRTASRLSLFLTLELAEIARVLVRFDHVADRIVNANHSAM